MKTPALQCIPLITLLRPTDSDLEAEWTRERKTAVTGRIAAQIAADAEIAEGAEITVDTGTSAGAEAAAIIGTVAATVAAPPEPLARIAPQRISRRRAVLVTSGIAAAVAALLAVPLLLPSGSPAGPPAASALETLANAAAAQKPLGHDQYVHTVYEDKANGYVTGMEIWAAADGKVWHKDTAAGTAMYYTLVPASGAVSYPSQEFLMGLPTDPDALGDYLRSHAHGSNSRDEAVFDTVGGMLSNGLSQPALRAAALRVLEDTPHVTAESGIDSLGRPATVVTFDDQSIRRGVSKALYFDPETSAFLGSRWTSSRLDATETVASVRIVDSVPAEVHRYADHYTDIGTCVTDRGVQTPDVCMHAQLGSRYNVTDTSLLPYVTTAAAPPNK